MSDPVHESLSDTDAPPRRTGVVRLLIGPLLVVVLVLGLAALAAFSPVGIVAAWLGYALTYLAIPYTVIAIVVGVVGRLRVKPTPPGGGQVGDFEREVEGFALFSQRVSLLLAAVLLLVLAVAGCLLMLDGEGYLSDSGGVLLVLGGGVVAGAVFTIAANAPQLYRPRVIAAERWAVANRTGAWRLILVSWIASPVMWVGYCIGGAAVFAMR